MRLDIYLNYPGNCEQAFRFYEKEIGGKISTMMRHGDLPDSKVPSDWKAAILHARLEIGKRGPHGGGHSKLPADAERLCRPDG